MSLEKEEAAGEVHTVVMVLQRERHCTRPQAINTIHVQINSLLRYADLMATMIRGNYDWSRLTHRYGTQKPRAPALRTTDT